MEKKASKIERFPARWRKAEPITGHCGAHQMQAMLAAVGIEREVGELYRTRIHRDGFGSGISWDHTYTMPWDISTILARHDLATTSYLRAGSALLPLALEALEEGHPLIINIRSTKDGGLHWVSVWDYDAERDTFRAYDSQYEDAEGGIGNVDFSPALLADHLPFGLLLAIRVHL